MIEQLFTFSRRAITEASSYDPTVRRIQDLVSQFPGIGELSIGLSPTYADAGIVSCDVALYYRRENIWYILSVLGPAVNADQIVQAVRLALGDQGG